MVGSIVMGTRIGGAAGREIADIEEDSDMARKVKPLMWLFNLPVPFNDNYNALRLLRAMDLLKRYSQIRV